MCSYYFHLLIKKMKSILICVIINVILQVSFHSVGANSYAYIYYKDAQCSNSTNKILGTLVYGYNEQRMKGRGIVKENYNGPCKYFDGGFYDFMYETKEKTGVFMLNGYCLQCHGVVGCSKTKNDCSGFQSYIPQENIYTSTGSSQNTGGSYGGGGSISYEIADEVENSVYREINRAGGSDFMYAVLGVMCGLSLFFILVVSSKITKRMLIEGRRQRGRGRIDSNKLMEGDDTSKEQQQGVYGAKYNCSRQ